MANHKRVHVLARKANLAMVRIPGSADGNMSGYQAVLKSNGDPDGDPGALIRTRVRDFLARPRFWGSALCYYITSPLMFPHERGYSA